MQGLFQDSHFAGDLEASRVGAMSHVFEDNEVVMKMIIEEKSNNETRVKNPQIALDWLVDRINLDPKIQIRYIDTKHQLAGKLTKGNFTRDEWNHLPYLFNISHVSLICCSQNFSLTSCPKTMAKGRRQDCGKIKAHSNEPDVNNLDKFLFREPSDCVEKPGDTQSIYRET